MTGLEQANALLKISIRLLKAATRPPSSPKRAPAKRSRPTAPRKKPARAAMPRWTPDEDRILSETYPVLGAPAALEALHDAGYTHRTLNGVSRHARRSGMRLLDRASREGTARELALDLVTDYLGMPLKPVDVAEVLRISLPRAVEALDYLAGEGLILKRVDPDSEDRAGAHVYLYAALDTPESA